MLSMGLHPSSSTLFQRKISLMYGFSSLLLSIADLNALIVSGWSILVHVSEVRSSLGIHLDLGLPDMQGRSSVVFSN